MGESVEESVGESVEESVGESAEESAADSAGESVSESEVGEGSEEARRRLQKLREQIVALDEELIRLVGERRRLVLEIGRLKDELDLPVLDPGREAQVVRRAAEIARKLGVDEELTRDVIWRIMASARDAQEGNRSWGPPDYPPPDS